MRENFVLSFFRNTSYSQGNLISLIVKSSYFCIHTQGIFRIFSGTDFIFRREEIISTGPEFNPTAQKKSAFLKNIMPLGLTERRGVEYLNIIKDKLVLTSAPYGPHPSFFIRNRNILF